MKELQCFVISLNFACDSWLFQLKIPFLFEFQLNLADLFSE